MDRRRRFCDHDGPGVCNRADDPGFGVDDHQRSHAGHGRRRRRILWWVLRALPPAVGHSRAGQHPVRRCRHRFHAGGHASERIGRCGVRCGAQHLHLDVLVELSIAIPAAVRLRVKFPDVVRPFRVPVSDNGFRILGTVCFAWVALGSWVAIFPGTLDRLLGQEYDFDEIWESVRACSDCSPLARWRYLACSAPWGTSVPRRCAPSAVTQCQPLWCDRRRVATRPPRSDAMPRQPESATLIQLRYSSRLPAT